MQTDFDQFVQLLRREIPDCKIVEFQARSLETLKGVMLTIAEAGLIQTLWNVLEHWISRHTNASIKISYKSADGKFIEVTYNKVNQRKVEEILSRNPPDLSKPTKLILPKNSSYSET